MKDLNCSSCGTVVLEARMRDFGFAIVFCVACAKRAVATGLIQQFIELGGTGDVHVHASRDDG